MALPGSPKNDKAAAGWDAAAATSEPVAGAGTSAGVVGLSLAPRSAYTGGGEAIGAGAATCAVGGMLAGVGAAGVAKGAGSGSTGAIGVAAGVGATGGAGSALAEVIGTAAPGRNLGGCA